MTQNYDLPQDDINISSVIGLEIAYADEVEFVYIDKSAKTFTNVNFIAGKDFLNIYVTPSKSKIDIKPKKRNGNTFYNVKLTAFHPKDRQIAAEKLLEIERHTVLVKYKTGNTFVKLLGTHLEAADVKIETMEPPTASYNGYKITITGEFTQAPLFQA